MLNVKIIADSASDLSSSFYDKYDIDMVPLTVHLNGEDYTDSKNISAKTVYEAMRNGAAPKTSQVTRQQFEEKFRTYAEQNQPVVYIAFSSELSGTYQAGAMTGKEIQEEFPEWEFHALDSKCASLGCGLVVLRAAELARQGAGVNEILQAASFHSAHMEHIFTVDDLEYLYRGGRVSKAQAFVGTLLKVKPLLHMEDGKLVPLEKIRGSKKVLKRMLDIMDERGKNLQEQKIGISHGDDEENARELAAMIKERFGNENVHIEMVGSSIGAHAGPGTIALFFLNETPEH